MTGLSIAARALAFAVGVNLTPVAAQTTTSDSNPGSAVPQTAYAVPSQNTAATPHWEWQYHYVGRHARYEGYWVLVR
jgi:hypothetical protein